MRESQEAGEEEAPLTPMQQKVVEMLRREFKPEVEPEGGEVSSGTPSPTTGAGARAGPGDETIPARMLNEFVYCPRLFYYEFVEGVFLENAETLRGSAIHQRVDSGSGELKHPAKRKGAPAESSQDLPRADGTVETGKEPPEIIHSRSVSMGSDRLGVSAKMDLIEVRTGANSVPAGTGEAEARPVGLKTPELFEGFTVCPVDYKAGSPREGSDGNELWDTDKMQLGLQALILRENGYRCEEGIIYYRGNKQRVRLAITPELIGWIENRIQEARRTMRGPIPGPLRNSPKCVRCSLAPVCLPDETRLLFGMPGDGATIEPDRAELSKEPGSENGSASDEVSDPPRRLIAARDDARALYLNTPGLRVGVTGDTLQIKDREKLVDTVRVRDVNHVALFGNIQVSTQAIQTLCEHEIPITFFSMGGWFYGLTRGHELKNVFLRRQQFRVSDQEEKSLNIARLMVHGKIRNHRVLMRRLHVEPPEIAVRRLKVLAEKALAAESIEELLGTEGAAASLYFENFAGMIKANEELTGEPQLETGGQMQFKFENRTRRPPTDPINALLSLAYSMLSKDATIAAAAVGFDPYVGFYHQPRFGRPALALDLMEEFRPLVAESAVLTAVNNRIVTPEDFVRAGKAVNLTAGGRKKFFQTYEQRISSLVTHPVFEYQVTYRRALELQARILAKTLTGEIPEYIPFRTR